MAGIYRIREVDGGDEEISDVLSDLHRLHSSRVRHCRHSIGVIGGWRCMGMWRSDLRV